MLTALMSLVPPFSILFYLTGVRLPGGVPIHRKMKLGNAHIVLLLLAAGLLAGACTREPVGQEAGEIRFRVLNEWQDVTKGASIYDGGTMASGSFKAAAYEHGTTNAYISPTTVSWVSSAWEFADGKHYWPASGSLDFHAWMPATPPSYIEQSYSAGHPGFTCTALPLTSAGQEGLQEYVYAFAADKSKAGSEASGVSLNFQHPFATISFRIAVQHTGLTLNSITLSRFENEITYGVNNNGSYSHNGGGNCWSSLSSSGDFVGSYSLDLDTGTAPYEMGPYLVIPQTFSPYQRISVRYTPDGEAALTKWANIPSLTWEAGHHYQYTFLLKTNFTVTVTDLETAQPNVTTDVTVTDLENGGYQDYTRYITP